MDVLWETLGFAAKGTITLVLGLLFVGFTTAIVFARSRRERPEGGVLHVRQVKEQVRELNQELRRATMPEKAFRKYQKEESKREKEEKKKNEKEKRTFVLTFDGDMMAAAVDCLRREVTALLSLATEKDEVLILLESPGGVVQGYGLAASQIDRLRKRGIRVVACVDKVAASGGYMMACVADEIIAAPFAIIGSIGVAMPLPNLHRLLKRFGVDYEDATAGEHKRTVSLLAEPTAQGREKLQEQIDETHQLFKDWVKEHRPSLDIDAVATGEYWLAIRAAELGLVDHIATSDDVILSRLEESEVLHLHYEKSKSLRDRVFERLMKAATLAGFSLKRRSA